MEPVPDIDLRRGYAYLEAGDLINAERCFLRFPNDADSLAQLSTIAYHNAHIDDSERLLRKAIKLNPDMVEYLFGLATITKARGREGDSLDIIMGLLDSHPDDDSVKMAAAGALLSSGEYQRCIELCSDLIKTYPDDVGLLNNMASAYREAGLIEQSESIQVNLIGIDPYQVDPYVNLMSTAHYDESMFSLEIVHEMADMLSLPALHTSLLNNVLGTCYEHIGEYSKSFEYYKKANDRIRSEFPPDANLDLRQQCAAVKQVFSSEMLESFKSDVDTPMVFIFGMPRSGSTLIEQIMINNESVETAGETKNMQGILLSLLSRVVSDPDGETFQIDIAKEGSRYISERYGEINSTYLIDKMPPNYQYIGLMYMLFPNAKFIYSDRNPMDACFSAWSIVFGEGNSHTYSINELAENYKICNDMVEFWESVLPEGTIHRVNYEDMVNNHESTVQSLCDYVGINYTTPMRYFHKKRRMVKTASVGQVNKPLYTSSVGRASRYGDLLKDLEVALND